MAYRVDLTARAEQDLIRIYRHIEAERSERAQVWFNGLERVVQGLESHPARGAPVAEDPALRQVFHGRKPHVYRVIYRIDEIDRSVLVLHIRHGARDSLNRCPPPPP